MIKLFLSLIFAFSASALFAQPDCMPQTKAFISGERIQYDVKYNWGLLWVDAGEVVFAVEDTVFNDRPSYWFKGYGRSKPKWDWVYTVRDTFDAIGTKGTLSPLYFNRKTSEGSYKVDNSYWYYPENNFIKGSVWNSDIEKTKSVGFRYEECVWDLLSAVYYARNLDYSQYRAGDKIPFNMVIDGKVNYLFIRFLGKEVMEMPSEKKYSTIKFSALLVDGTIFDGGEDMTVWVSDDENKIPLKVEAKIKVGWIKAYLVDTKGLKYNDIQPLAD